MPKTTWVGLVAMTGRAPTNGVSLAKERELKRKQIEAIFRAAAQRQPPLSLLLFPGWTSWCEQNTETFVEYDYQSALWREAEWIMKLTRENHLACVFQVSTGQQGHGLNLSMFYDPDDAAPHMLVDQLFTTSKEVDDHPIMADTLKKLLSKGGNRRIQIAGLDIAVMICGENNLVYAPSKKKRPASLRCKKPDDYSWCDYDIMFNPAHDKMGNAGKLVKRFKILSSSRGGPREQYCLHCTNATSSPWKAHLYGFRNGRPVITENSLNDPNRTIWDNDNKKWCISVFEVATQ